MSPPPDIMSQSNDEDKDSDYNNDIRDGSLGTDALRDIDDTVAQPCSHTRSAEEVCHILLGLSTGSA